MPAISEVTQGPSVQHEGGARQLQAEPCGVHSNQRMDADRFGTRRVFASAIGIFTLRSLLCGVSSDIRLLVACRVLQGCGGAMMVPVGRLTLGRTFAKSELIRTMGFVFIPAMAAPTLGPIAGGLIVG